MSIPEKKYDKYEARTQKKKEAIKSAALELFQKEGFVKANIKAIAMKAQVSQVSIYNYFQSKEGLVLACAQKLVQETMEKAMMILQQEMPFLEKADQAFLLCNKGAGGVLMDYFSNMTDQNSDMLKLFWEGVTKSQRNVYIQFIETGKKEGYIDVAIPTDTILKYIMAMSTIQVEQNDEEQLKDLYKLLLHGCILHS